MNVEFFIPGLPATKGSSVSFAGSDGRIVHKASCDRLAAWARNASACALVAMRNRRQSIAPKGTPVLVGVTFVLPRPQTHWRGKAKVLRTGVPQFHTGRPDIDKLQRALLDALSGQLYADDSQVVEVKACKRFASHRDGRDVGVHVHAWSAEDLGVTPNGEDDGCQVDDQDCMGNSRDSHEACRTIET